MPGKQASRLLISSRDAAALRHLQGCCQRQPGLVVSTRLVTNGHTDPLYGLEQMPDFLLLRVSHLWREELAALLQRPAKERPPLLVCGPLDDREGVRLAMQAGARDFLPEPVSEAELRTALSRMMTECHAGGAAGGKLIAVINAKGGSGATLLACNLAHQLSNRGGTLLLDLDLQFGSVAHYLDVHPSHSHLEVMQQVDELDGVALRGFCSHFSPDLHVLGGRAGELCLTQDVRLEQLEALLRLARDTYDWVVADLPRQIDHLTGITLEQADRVYIVVQQSLSHLKDAARLVRILRDDLGVQGNRIQVVVNRYNKAAPVSLKDIAEALRCVELQKLPNDYAAVTESQNTGVPLVLHAPRSQVALALRELSQDLLGIEDARQGLLKRTIGRLFRG
ncbi:Type II/IV secretion system ATPase TadZ/CpaE, associated with Flp pilus assembly [Metapseudomonas furukawaii]|uniref:Type II/IV secretion system ATPase TadZ/CpaE n=1 Tax=Metapseudomonas furukawaii TaxID=1149133 RepID=A0AAD1C1Y2_METFU|nr:Type II/IV secretion system ATPase TadZ/CpaE, associated with Flp pilus assembly [Pseudomonas furukawaii]BAU75305.1 type II/IV secretion system ATPase TadZ/CpaE [Pseudomonas furukawaii]